MSIGEVLFSPDTLCCIFMPTVKAPKQTLRYIVANNITKKCIGPLGISSYTFSVSSLYTLGRPTLGYVLLIWYSWWPLDRRSRHENE